MIKQIKSHGILHDVIFDDDISDKILCKTWSMLNGYARTCEVLDGKNHTIFMHRLVYGNDYEVVHHINGNSLDNRMENLCGMTRSEHSRYHSNLFHEQMLKKQQEHFEKYGGFLNCGKL